MTRGIHKKTLRKAMAPALAATLALTAGAQGVTATELLYSGIAARHPLDALRQEWAANISEATDGRVTMRILDTPAAPAPRLYDAVRTGIVDSGHAFLGFLGEKAPLLQIGTLPKIASSAEANAVAMSRTYQKYFKEKNELDGVRVMGFISNPPGVLCSLKEPIDSLASLKSLKMWSLPGYAAKAMEALDVPIVSGPATEMYALVSKGTVDGFNGISLGDALLFKTAQYAKSCTMVDGGVFTAVFAVMINENVWNSLDEADQDAIDAVSHEMFGQLSHISDEWAADSLAKFKEQGGEIVTPSAEFDAQLTKAWTPMIDAWIESADAAGVNGQEVMDYYLAQIAELEAR